MKNKLINLSKENGASKIGFLEARKFTEISTILEKRGEVSFCENDIEKRINPFLLMQDARSIVVCLFSYNIKNRGTISNYANGLDYHKVVIDKLKNIAKPLVNDGYKTMFFCDNSPLPERYLAYLCGLGFFGKNNMLINEEIGSKFFIGLILTDCVFCYDKPLTKSICIGCDKCIKSCPGGAIGENFSFDEKRCLSYITQKKGELEKEEQEIIKKGRYIWGCDVCTNVCPYNIDAPVTDILEFSENPVLDVEIPPDLTNKEFINLYGNRAFSWRGKKVLIRNKKILENE